MVDLFSLAKHSFVSEFLMGFMALHHLFTDREERRNWAVEKMLSKNLATTYRYRLQGNVPACRFLQIFTFCAVIDRIMLWFIRHFLNQLTGCHSRADIKT